AVAAPSPVHRVSSYRKPTGYSSNRSWPRPWPTGRRYRMWGSEPDWSWPRCGHFLALTAKFRQTAKQALHRNERFTMRMKKTHLLAALGLTLVCAGTQAAETYTVPTSVPEGSFFFENFLVRFAKNADLLTAGEVKIRPVGAGVIVPALQVFESVQNGVLKA